MHAQVVEKYIFHDGHVILAGDAAHRFPPAGGFGMNTGIQDVHNLAWKLAAVLNSIAPPALLSTYEEERRPIAQENTTLSISNYRAAMSIPSVLGLDPSVARLIHQTINSSIGSIIPPKLQTTVLKGIFALGRTQLSSLFLNRYNPLGSIRLEKVGKILEGGQSLQLQFPAEDLGFRYKTGALVPEMETSEELNLDRSKDYVPSSSPGSRLPHLHIAILDENLRHSRKEVCSTLDLTNGEQVEFLLFLGSNKSGCLWGDAMLQIAKAFDVMLKIVMIWPVGTSKGLCGKHSKMPTFSQKTIKNDVNSSENEADEFYYVQQWRWRNRPFVLDVEDVGDQWWDLYQVPPYGAILVRPDDHIAWRCRKSTDFYPLQEFSKIFEYILKKPLPNFVNQ